MCRENKRHLGRSDWMCISKLRCSCFDMDVWAITTSVLRVTHNQDYGNRSILRCLLTKYVCMMDTEQKKLRLSVETISNTSLRTTRDCAKCWLLLSILKNKYISHSTQPQNRYSYWTSLPIFLLNSNIKLFLSILLIASYLLLFTLLQTRYQLIFYL